MVFASASTNNITIIKTGMSAGFVGDAVLYLQDTACENILFLGSCGLINTGTNLKIGDLILPTAAYPLESFSAIVTGRLEKPEPVYPDQDFMELFRKHIGRIAHECPVVSFSSLHEEENHLDLFRELKADAIEMETAALFLAARKAGKKALALLFVSDILGKIRFYEKLSPENKESLSRGAEQASKALKEFTSSL